MQSIILSPFIHAIQECRNFFSVTFKFNPISAMVAMIFKLLGSAKAGIWKDRKALNGCDSIPAKKAATIAQPLLAPSPKKCASPAETKKNTISGLFTFSVNNPTKREIPGGQMCDKARTSAEEQNSPDGVSQLTLFLTQKWNKSVISNGEFLASTAGKISFCCLGLVSIGLAAKYFYSPSAAITDAVCTASNCLPNSTVDPLCVNFCSATVNISNALCSPIANATHRIAAAYGPCAVVSTASQTNHVSEVIVEKIAQGASHLYTHTVTEKVGSVASGLGFSLKDVQDKAGDFSAAIYNGSSSDFGTVLRIVLTAIAIFARWDYGRIKKAEMLESKKKFHEEMGLKDTPFTSADADPCLRSINTRAYDSQRWYNVKN